MRTTLRLTLAACILGAVAGRANQMSQAPQQSTASASTRSAFAPFDLGIGTNLGNTLEAPMEGQWNPPAQPYYFTDFKAAGFTTVRIPCRWDEHMSYTAPYTINATWLERVQTVVGYCVSSGLQCILNSHDDTWLDNVTTFETELPRFQALWTQVGAYLADQPPALAFEAFNEPHIMDTPELNQMLMTFYNAVRPTNPTRTLILGWLSYMGPSWIQGNHSNWNAMVIPGNGSDPNLAVEVHSYDPYDVCSPNPTAPWDPVKDMPAMDHMFGNLTQWSADHGNIPVFVGESGCSVEQVNRVQWYSDFMDHCLDRKGHHYGLAGCLVWDDDGKFGIYDRATRTFNQSIMAALGL